MSIDNECLDTSHITIPTGADGAIGATGAAGTNGTNGTDGIFGGFSASWLFDATTGGAPASTFLKFDNTVLSSVTGIVVNDTNVNSVDHDAFLNSFNNTVDSVNNYGLIRVWKKFDSNTFWVGKLTAVVDGGTSRSLTVTYILGNGTFLASDEVVLTFSPSGASSESDKEVLHADFIASSTQSAADVSIKSYTVPANTLSVDGDQLHVASTMYKVGAAFSSTIKARFAADIITYGDVPWGFSKGVNKLVINATATRKNSTNLYVNMQSHYINTVGKVVASYGYAETVAWDSTVNNVIDILGKGDGGTSGVGVEEFIIKKFDK